MHCCSRRPALAQVQGAGYPLRAEDGNLIQNSKIGPDLVKEAEKLPGAMIAANPQGDVIVGEFLRPRLPVLPPRFSAGIETMIKAVHRLRLVLVPFPVSEPFRSHRAGGTRGRKSVPPRSSMNFTARGMRGAAPLTDSARLRLPPTHWVSMREDRDAADDKITDIMKAHLRFASALGSKATPLFLVQDVMIDGYPGRKTLQDVVRSVRKCKKAVC